MSVAIDALIFIIIIFSFTFTLFDINKNAQLKQIIYEDTRATNQNSLIELQTRYNEGEIITTPMMLERWLANFVDNDLSNIESVVIKFSMIETDPPLYLITVQGKTTASAILSADLYTNFISGTMIISD